MKTLTPRKLETLIKNKLGGPSPRRDFIARYTGAVGHEARKPDEQSKLEFWGQQLPVHRAVAKQMAAISKAEFAVPGATGAKALEAQVAEWNLWVGLWHQTQNFDVRSIVLIWMSNKNRAPLRRLRWKDLFGLAETIDNWALSDGLSMMIADVLEHDPKLLSHFKKWNKSKNPWLRRQSIVGIYCYARFRKKPIPAEITLGLLEKLLDDPHFYVQRGVGWTLREVDRIDSALQRRFVEKHLHRISGVAWFAASELYPEKARKVLVIKRKKKRQE
ncbi:MAG: DNA alkylation repair protein [Bdellovibrio sp.]|jgi:hypothetical protein